MQIDFFVVAKIELHAWMWQVFDVDFDAPSTAISHIDPSGTFSGFLNSVRISAAGDAVDEKKYASDSISPPAIIIILMHDS